MRVLLVEDNDDLRNLFARLLRRQGVAVCEAENGQAALDALPHFSPDLVLTDLMMPRLDGFQLIRRLRSEPACGSVPVVAMTASSSIDMRRRACEAGAANVLTKPVSAMDLSACINAFLPPVGYLCDPLPSS